MSWVGPAVKAAAKYGPQAKLLWDTGGKPAQAIARRRFDQMQARRAALQKAETVEDGRLLRQVHAGQTVWVVFSGSAPVDAYPRLTVPLSTLVEHAKLDELVTPEAFRDGLAIERLKRATKRARRRRHDRLADSDF